MDFPSFKITSQPNPNPSEELNEDDETIKDIKAHHDYLMNYEDILEKLKRIEKASDRDQVIPSKNGEELDEG